MSGMSTLRRTPGRRARTRSASGNDRVDEAIALAAHELREPLLGAKAAIAAFLQLRRDDAESIGLLQRSLAEVEYSTGLLDALLRLLAGDGGIAREPVDVVALVRRAAASCAVSAGERVEVRAPRRAATVGDPLLLRAAIENVIRNALAYSPPDRPVVVAVKRRSGTIVIAVSDEGPGIPGGEHEAIFDRSVRGSAGRAREGTGLGLYLVRAVVEAHRGEIRIDVDRPGATFAIFLAS